MVRRGNYRRHFGQRLGLYSADVRTRLAQTPSPVWVQAVSVGEMLVALKLIAALREARPGAALVLSTTTTTGFQLARERAPADVPVLYTPIDLRFVVRRAFDVLRPAQMVIVDGGLWPNQLLEARRRKIRVTLANARLSPRSEGRFRRFRFVARKMFGLLDEVCVPEAADVSRWQALGVGGERITNTGSIKYDDTDTRTEEGGGKAAPAEHAATPELRAVIHRLGVKTDAPVLLGGSTHPGEERLLAEVFVALRPRFPDLFLIIAPRHVERTKDILAELSPFALRIVLRTDTPTSPGSSSKTAPPTVPEVFLLDTTGELSWWYALATVVFVGKSLTAFGGQNPAEAIAAGKPVLFGPHMENFASLAAQLIADRAAIQVADATELRRRCDGLLEDAAERARMTAAAQRLLLTHRGSAGRTAALVFPAPVTP